MTIYSKSILIFLLTLLAATITSEAKAFSARHDKVANIFKSKAEPTAKDAVWTDPKIFKVGVIDNGSNRNGYAEYVCEVLMDEGFRGEKVWVQVIDIAKLINTKKWVTIGEAHCR